MPWNPGQLPYGLTVSKLLEPHKSLPANPLIADPLFWTGYVDKVGTGTEDIVNLCKEKGLKAPEYHQEEDFRVVIWRNNGRKVNQSDSESKEKSKEKTLDKVHRLISENHKITTSELAELCGVSENSIYKTVRKLRESGRIIRKGGAKGGEWEVLK